MAFESARVLNCPPEVGQTSRGFIKKDRIALKLGVAQRFLAGEDGSKLLARHWSIPEEKIRTWGSRYLLHGIDELLPKRSTYSAQFKLKVLSHQDLEQLSSRRVAAIYDIRNPNQVVVWRLNLDQSEAEALEKRKQGRLNKEQERSCQALQPIVATDSAQTLLAANDRVRATVAYLKKSQALIRLKRSAAPTKRTHCWIEAPPQTAGPTLGRRHGAQHVLLLVKGTQTGRPNKRH